MRRKFLIHKKIYGCEVGSIKVLYCERLKGEWVPTDLKWYRVFLDAKIDHAIEDVGSYDNAAPKGKKTKESEK